MVPGFAALLAGFPHFLLHPFCLLLSHHRPFNSNIIKTHARMGLAAESWLEKDEFGRRELVMGRCHMEPSSDAASMSTE